MEQQQQKPPPELTAEQRIQLFKATAVRAVLSELIAEHRDEIIKRARAKLVALGIEFKDEDMSV